MKRGMCPGHRSRSMQWGILLDLPHSLLFLSQLNIRMPSPIMATRVPCLSGCVLELRFPTAKAGLAVLCWKTRSRAHSSCDVPCNVRSRPIILLHDPLPYHAYRNPRASLSGSGRGAALPIRRLLVPPSATPPTPGDGLTPRLHTCAPTAAVTALCSDGR